MLIVPGFMSILPLRASVQSAEIPLFKEIMPQEFFYDVISIRFSFIPLQAAMFISTNLVSMQTWFLPRISEPEVCVFSKTLLLCVHTPQSSTCTYSSQFKNSSVVAFGHKI